LLGRLLDWEQRGLAHVNRRIRSLLCVDGDFS
jgi:hypothetical protein